MYIWSRGNQTRGTAAQKKLHLKPKALILTGIRAQSESQRLKWSGEAPKASPLAATLKL